MPYVIGSGGVLFEGLCTNYDEGVISWVDIEEKTIFRWIRGGGTSVYKYPHIPSNIFSIENNKAVVLDDLGIASFCFKTCELVRTIDMARELRGSGLRGNDGVALEGGHYLVGAMDISAPESRAGAVFVVSDAHVKKVAEYNIPNLFCNIGTNILIADSQERIIYAHNRDGAAGPVWLDSSQGSFIPDGGCFGADGAVYIADWGGGRICKLDRHGETIGEILVGSLKPTNCKFFGASLVVSSATIGMSKRELLSYQESGSVIILGQDT